jgi:adenylate kinase family enzyme
MDIFHEINLFIIFGPPASGKSTLSDFLKYRFIDSNNEIL